MLHLINQYEIDIYDVPLAEITEQYLQYIDTMQILELNIASEYLVMAATLVAIKSEMLLPNPEPLNEEFDEYMEDPKDELIKRLIEYRKYKEAASRLKEKEKEANQIFTRPPQVFESNKTAPPVERGDISIYDMLGALAKVLERRKWNQPLDTTVQKIEIPIEERMEQVLEKVNAAEEGILFESMFPYRTKSYIVITFLAILELMKNNQVFCKQTNHFDTLLIYN